LGSIPEHELWGIWMVMQLVTMSVVVTGTSD